MNEQQVLAVLREPNGSEKLAQRGEEAWESALSLLTQEEPAAAAFFVRMVKQKKYRQRLNEWLGERRLLYRLLTSSQPKTRKNAARLIGALGAAEDAGPLQEALEHESQRLARPSMILALGALGTPESLAYLRNYSVEPAANPAEEKHARAEREALQTVLAAHIACPEHRFLGLPKGTKLELRCAKGLERVLAQGFASEEVRMVRPGCVTVSVSEWGRLSRCRVWREALIPLSRGVKAEPEAIARAVGGKVLEILKAAYDGVPPYPFRLELKGRAELAKAAARELAGEELVNAPSHYEAEIRAEEDLGQVHLYLKLCAAPDNRFAYRLGAVPASIHPANAAGVVELAAPYLKEGALVLDPCCGSGTLLIERGLYGKCRKLTGVDIYGPALKIAMENMKAAHLGGRLVRSDFLQFAPPEPVDELFANLPFGNRVGSHGENLRLYQGLAERLPQWIRTGGVAVLYTMEGKLLERCVYGQRRLQILRRYTVEAGGLEPRVLIVRVI